MHRTAAHSTSIAEVAFVTARIDLLITHHPLADGQTNTPSICSASRALERELLLVRIHADRQRRLEISDAPIEQVALVLHALRACGEDMRRKFASVSRAT